MVRGSIREHLRKDGVHYEVVVDLGVDPVTNKRRQRTRSFHSKREAKRALTAWMAEIDKGTAVDRSRQTVAELLRYWLDTYAQHHVRAVTLEGYTHTINYHIIPSLGAVPVQKLTPDQLQSFYSAKLNSCGPRTVQLCHMRIKQALGMAVRLDLVARNVADVVTPPRVPRKEMTVWDEVQARCFLDAASHSSYGPIWITFLASGARRGEVLGLKWQDIDFDEHTMSFRQAIGLLKGVPTIGLLKSKSAKRTVAVPTNIIEALRAHKVQQNERRLALGVAWEDHALVFPAANGKPLNPNNIVRDYNRWVVAAGVPRIRIHDLRHTQISILLASGVDINLVAEIAGHNKPSFTLDRYGHVLHRKRREGADKIGDALFGSQA